MFKAVSWCGCCSCCAGGVDAGVCVEAREVDVNRPLVSVISEVGVGSETEMGDLEGLEPLRGGRLDKLLASVPWLRDRKTSCRERVCLAV